MVTTMLNASPITMEKARGNALNFFTSSIGKKRIKGNVNMELACSIDAPKSLAYTADSLQPVMFAFNLEGGGFILASGDDAAEPILAYSDNGTFHLDSLPPNAKWWIEGYAKEIAWARQNGLTAESTNAAQTNSPRKARATVGTLLTTTWNQEAPYNNQCVFNGTTCLAGCGATAMAQVLCFWAKNGFKRGCRALPAYTTETNKYSVGALGAVSVFDWDNMTSSSRPSTANQKTAVAKLMRYCGQSINMDYGPDWSGSATYDIYLSLKDNFFYNSSMAYIDCGDMSASAFEEKIYNEIAAKRPVIMSGYSDASGRHLFVCDGYNATTGKYHFNWGWGGSKDGMFAMTALNPYGRNYNNDKEAIIGINPNAASQYVTQSADSKTITFYNNNNKSAHASETIYDLSSFPNNLKNKASITKVVFDASFASARPNSTNSWFNGMSALTTITNLGYLNTSAVTNMARMFYECRSLTNLDLSKFNTANVTNMSNMFLNCNALKTVNLSSFNTAKVTLFNSMFNGCTSLTSIDLSKFNTANSTNMAYMFKNCQTLKSITLTNFNTAKVVDMSNMFYGCTGLTSIDLSKFNTAKVTSMNNMFKNCKALKTVTLTSFNTSIVTNMDFMFDACIALTSLDLSKFNFSKVTSSTCMVRNCKALKNISIPATMTKVNNNAFDGVGTASNPCAITAPSGFNFGVNTNEIYFKWKYGYFYLNNTKVTYALFSGTKLTFYYDASPWNKSGNKYKLNTETNDPGWSEKNASVTEVAFDASFQTARPTTTYKWFSEMTKLTKITNIGYLNTSSTTNMGLMFNGCSALTSINLSKFNTTNVSNMNYMFDGCSALTSLNLSKFDLSKVTASSYMLRNCKAIKSLSIPATMTKAHERAFDGVGTTSAPCSITAPSGFNFGIDITGPYFKWKYGYFFLEGNKVSYALLSGTKLSFFHDALPWKRSGNIFTLNTAEKGPGWRANNASVTEVAFDASFQAARPTATYQWFSEMTNLAKITNIGYLNTSNTTNMSYMFDGCSALTELDLSKFDLSKVTSSSSMLRNCKALKKLHVSSTMTKADDNAFTGVGTSSAPCAIIAPSGLNFGVYTSGPYFFWKAGCFFINGNIVSYANLSGSKLTFYHDELQASRTGRIYRLNTDGNTPEWSESKASVTEVEFDTSFSAARPTSTYKWFFGMTNLSKITNIGNLNTSNTTRMDYMFSGCSALKSIDLSKFNISKAINMSYMFEDCSALTSLDLSKLDITNVTSSKSMCRGCKALKELSIHASMTKLDDYAFSYVGSNNSPCIITAPSGFDFEKNLTGLYFYWKAGTFFLKGNKVSYAHIDGYKMTFYHDAMPWSRAGKIFRLSSTPGWNDNTASITEVVFDPSFSVARPTSTSRWFYKMKNLEKITNLENLNTSSTTNMDYMFGYCSALTNLDLSKLDMSKVKSSTCMMDSCISLKSISIPATLQGVKNGFFYGVGTKTSPCILTAPSGYDFGVDTSTFYFEWGSGYFYLKDNKVSYALLSGTKLSFFHDALPWTRSGNKYNLNKGYYKPDWSESNSSITEVEFDSSFSDARPKSTYFWFSDLASLTTVSGMENLNMSEVTTSDYMFNGCEKLASITLPNTIKVIGSSMFNKCSSLTSIDIPASVDSIEEYAFFGCSKQEQVIVRFNKPLKIDVSTFPYRKKAYLYVPAGCMEAFKAAQYWKDFKGIYALGDVNHDGQITISDVMLIVDYILGEKPNGFYLDCADVNKDNMISVADVQIVVKLVVGN